MSPSIDTEEITSTIIQTIANHMNVSIQEITLSTSLEKDLGCDSLDYAMIDLNLGEEFDIKKIPVLNEDSLIANITVQHIVDAIKIARMQS